MPDNNNSTPPGNSDPTAENNMLSFARDEATGVYHLSVSEKTETGSIDVTEGDRFFLDFLQDNLLFVEDGNDLVLNFPGGAKIVLTDYLALHSSENPPGFILPDGQVIGNPVELNSLTFDGPASAADHELSTLGNGSDSEYFGKVLGSVSKLDGLRSEQPNEFRDESESEIIGGGGNQYSEDFGKVLGGIAKLDGLRSERPNEFREENELEIVGGKEEEQPFEDFGEILEGLEKLDTLDSEIPDQPDSSIEYSIPYVSLPSLGQTSFSISDVNISEGGLVTFTVTRTGDAEANQTVDFATSIEAGDNSEAIDFTPNNNTLTFATGVTSQTFTVQTTADAIYEGAETFTVTLSNNSAGSVLGDAVSVGTILDDGTGPPPFDPGGPGTPDDDTTSFSVDDVSISEGGLVTFTVTRSGDAEADQTVDFATSIEAGDNSEVVDFAPNNNTLTFATGVTSQTFTVQTTADAIYEGAETFTVTLSNNSAGSVIGDAVGVGTILDDGTGPDPDGPGPLVPDDDTTSFSVDDVSISEGGLVTFTVTRSGDAEADQTVDFATSIEAGDNSEAIDFTPNNNTLTFATGVTSQTFTVQTTADAIYEGAETFTVTLSGNSTGSTITDSVGVGTILDDGTGPDPDGPGPLLPDDDRPTILVTSETEVENTDLVHTVTLSNASEAVQTYSFTIADNTATAGSDYNGTSTFSNGVTYNSGAGTIDVPAGVTSFTVTVTGMGDAISEPTETYDISVGGVAATGTITDDDGGDIIPPTLADQTFSYNENQIANATVATLVSSDNFAVTGFTFDATSTQVSTDTFYAIDNTGKITITAAGVAAGVNDFESGTNTGDYDVVAADAAGNTTTATITLNELDLDDTPPTLADQTFSYNENQIANATVATLVSSDNVAVTGFTFSATGTQVSTDTFYAIDNTGKITITAAGVAAGVNDFESGTNTGDYDVVAADDAGNTTTATITLNELDLDDTPPTLADQTFSYNENQIANATVATLVSSDNVAVTGFTFSATGTQVSTDTFYAIDNTGKITITAAGVAAGVNDFESGTNTGDYDVIAADAAGNTTTATITLNELDLDDTPPTLADQTFSYNENQIANATVATLVSSDNVAVTGFTFSATGTQVSTDTFYAIDNTGKITITAAGVAAGVNDFEVGTNTGDYDVVAADAAGNTTTATITLNELDLDDTSPTLADQTFSYNENQIANATVATLVSSDNVAVTGFTFSATGTQVSTDTFYAIDNTGKITITAAGVAAGVNDFEVGTNTGDYDVIAADAAGNTTTATITLNELDLDDTPPTLADQTFSYNENQIANATVATLVSSDNVAVTGFTFSATGTQVSTDTFYAIDNTGKITITAAGVAAGVNDFESGTNTGDYDVIAADAAGNTTTATITLNELDLDDTPPTLADQTFSYNENQIANATVATLVSSDNVAVTGFTFSATGTQVSTDTFYAIDNTGKITITAAGVAAGVNDFESGTNTGDYDVIAADAAGNTTTATITLNELDLDDTSPTLADQTFSYNENQIANATVATLVSSDNVAVTGFTFSATGTQVSTDTFYAIDNTGKITITAAGVAAGVNDFESGTNTGDYDVIAADAAGNTTTATITLNELDLDDTPPTLADQTFSYNENQIANATVATLVSSDNVAVTGFTFSATGTQVSTDTFYAIDNTGKITITAAGVAAGVNDFESGTNTGDYDVIAADAAGNTTTATITLNELNVNEIPEAADNTIGLAIDTSHVLTVDDFGFTDEDGDSLASIKIIDASSIVDSGSTGGQLLLGAGDGSYAAVADNTVITRAQIDAGYLVFKPDSSETGSDYQKFTFTVNDGAADSASTYTITYDIATALTVSDPAEVDEGKSTVFIIDLSAARVVATVLDLTIGGDVDTNDYNTALFYKNVAGDGSWTWDPVAAGDQVTIGIGDTRAEVKVTTIQNDDDNADGDNNQTTGTVDPTNEAISLTATINNYSETDMANTSDTGSTVINDYPSLIVSAPVTVTEGDDAIFEVTLSGKKSDTTDVVLSLGGEIDTSDYDTTGYEYSIDDGATWIAVAGDIEGDTITIPLSTSDGGVDDRIQGVLVKITTLTNNDTPDPDVDEVFILNATTADAGVANANIDVSGDTLIVETIPLSTNEDTAQTLSGPAGFTYSILGQGANGTVEDDGAGTLTYTPDTNLVDGLDTHYSGTDSFSIIKTNDASGVSTTASVDVNVIAVADQPPITISLSAPVADSVLPTEYVLNGSFESYTNPTGTDPLTLPKAGTDLTSWTFDTDGNDPLELYLTGGTSGVSGITDSYAIDTSGSGKKSVTLTQVINGLTSGETYTVTFDYAIPTGGTSTLGAYWDDGSGGGFVSVATVSEATATNAMQTATVNVVAGATNTLQFLGDNTGDSGGGDATGIYIDNVSIQAPSVNIYTYNVDITTSLVDTDGSETLQPLTISSDDIPVGSDPILKSADGLTTYVRTGVDDGVNIAYSWTVPADELAGLKLTVNEPAVADTLNLTASVTTIEASNLDSASNSATALAVAMPTAPVNDVPTIGDNTLIMANESGFVGSVTDTVDTYFSTDGGNTFSWDPATSILPDIYSEGQLVTITFDDATSTVSGTIDGGATPVFSVVVNMQDADATDITYNQPNDLLGIKEVFDGGIVLPGGGNNDTIVLGFKDSGGNPSDVDAIIVAHNLIEDTPAEIADATAEHTVNTNNFYIGVDSNNMNAGDQLIMDFATVASDGSGNTSHENDVAEMEISLFNFGSAKSGDELYITVITGTLASPVRETVVLLGDSSIHEQKYTVTAPSGEAFIGVEFLAGNESSFKLGIESISSINYNKDFDMQLDYDITDADGDSDGGSVTISLDGDEIVIYDSTKTAIDAGLEQDGTGATTDDVLVLPTSQNIEFSDTLDTIPDLSNFEIIDLTQNGTHALFNLSVSDVTGITDVNNLLTIITDAGDSVELTNEWTETGAGTGVYVDNIATPTVTVTITGAGTVTNTSILADGVVSGIYYETSSGLNGFTEADGSFDYLDGDTVTFKIGNIVVGNIDMNNIGDAQVFLQDLASVDRTDLSDEYLENMAVLLQSLDSDSSDNILITQAMHEAFADDNFILSDMTEEQIIGLIEKTGRVSVTEEEAMEHVKDMLIKLTDLTEDDFADSAGETGTDALSNSTSLDIVVGEGEDDMIFDNVSAETMEGEIGNDLFILNAPDDSLGAINLFSDSASGDILDLRDLLAGEDQEANNLDQYLNFDLVGNDTVVSIDTDGVGPLGISHEITLINIDLTAAGTLSDQNIINNLLLNGVLLTE